MNPGAQQRILAAFCIAAGLAGLGVGGLALWIGAGLVLFLGLILAAFP